MTTLEDISQIIESLVDKEPETFSGEGQWASPWTKGTAQRRHRLEAIATYAAERWKGDLLEIGAYCGQTTIILAEIAKKHKRRVIAIDPWEVGRQNCDGHEYGEFLKATKPWKRIIDVIKLPSEDEKAIETIKARELCFAYVDGRHTYENCYSDIMACAHAVIVAVDDLVWNVDVERAFYDAQADSLKSLIRHEMTTEAYLCE